MLTVFDRNGIWYLRGTVRAGEESRSVYETTGLRVGGADAEKRAHALRIRRENAILDELLYGEKAVVTWTEAAARRIEHRAGQRRVKRPDLAHQPDPEAWYVLRITDFFRTRMVDGKSVADRPVRTITQADIEAYFEKVHAGHKLSTRMRALAAYKGVMNNAERKGWIDTIPLPASLPEKWDNLAEPVEKMLHAEEVQLFVRLAVPHFRPFVATAFGTGRRGGELLYLSRTKNLRWERGNERLFFGVTKTGKPIHVRLPQFAVDELAVWIASRQDAHGAWTDEHDALFLTDKGEPYRRPRRQRGGVFKTAMGNLRKRVAAAIAAWRDWYSAGAFGAPPVEPATAELVAALAGHADRPAEISRFLDERLAVVRQVSGHWGRHNAASHLYDRGADDHEVMDHVGWQDIRSAKRYRHRSKRQQQRMADMLDFGAEAVQPMTAGKKTA